MDPSIKWLLFEATLPLIGTALIYVALTGCFAFVESPFFTFKWDEAVDSLGWLYGAAVLAFQAGFKGWGVDHLGYIPQGCIAIAVTCFLLLFAAMCAKAADSTWRPKRRMKIGATVITGLVLLAGYRTQVLMCCASGGVQ
ncbi:hypothetical protein [Pseudomonas sp. PNP]|uniref:hypothetical protein n=1 Tax=Pseudomonas sp. PNP TaxID=361819 RepID=UPI001AECA244|nr:hypothetical protein [Pseudomonas sp. PNP]MBP2841193.1 hypothetical protein [Pseudomonas sp. PNP]